MTRPVLALYLVLASTAACANSESRAAAADGPLHESLMRTVDGEVCQVVQRGAPLPDEVRETSGLARSARDAGLFWTHNDAGNSPELYGIDTSGRLVQRVRVTGAGLVDWEDIEAASCGDAACLYVGDIGDNDGERAHVTIYRIEEPAAGAVESAHAEALHARYPDGPRDAESLFAGPDGTLYLVTKGRGSSIGLYRYPAPQRPGVTVTLEAVRELAPQPGDEQSRVTGATASPDGRWVAIRTYDTLKFYRFSELLGSASAEPLEQDLRALGEAQGESVVLANDGTVWLSSEAESRDLQPTWSRLQCTLPE